MSYQKVPQENYPPPGYGTVYPPPSAPPQPLSDDRQMAAAYPYPAYPYGPPLPPHQQQQHYGPYNGGGYQGYFNQPGVGYFPPPHSSPSQAYHCDHYHHHHHDDGPSGFLSFLRGCLMALCCCCMLEECCF